MIFVETLCSVIFDLKNKISLQSKLLEVQDCNKNGLEQDIFCV
jgi:hypothetical protein